MKNVYVKAKYRFPLIASVIDNKQKGKFIVESNKNSIHAFVMNKFGFCQDFYDVFNEDVFFKTICFIINKQYSKLRFYTPTNPIKTFLEESSFAEKATRIQFEYKYNFLGNKTKLLEIRPFLHGDLTQNDFGLSLTNRYWDGAEDFVENALAVGAFDTGKLVGICYAAGVGLNRAEIDVFVDEEYRHAGIGSDLVHLFVDRCREKNILPNWDCYANNEASVKLAQKTGFIEVWSYDFYNISGNQ